VWRRSRGIARSSKWGVDAVPNCMTKISSGGESLGEKVVSVLVGSIEIGKLTHGCRDVRKENAGGLLEDLPDLSSHEMSALSASYI